MEYLPGKKNEIADALSRHPVNVPDEEDISDALTINAIFSNKLQEPSQVIALDLNDIQNAGNTDEEYQYIMNLCKLPLNKEETQNIALTIMY